MAGRWDKPGIPHKGWCCIGITDVREGLSKEDTTYAACEMCDRPKIRYVHTMVHDDHDEDLGVGCVCAEKMCNSYKGKEAEQVLRKKASRRSRWLSRKWRISGKGNPYLNANDIHVVIYRTRQGPWMYRVDGKASNASYSSVEEAKLASFDDFWSALQS
ncbi:hypothetical protein JYT15_00230 [Acidimicrobium ferrooxidans]|nr:hypothetical protein [Acidimicrobium ferrooxidans]